MDDRCVMCKEEVVTDDKAILCDVCESWEHVTCMRQSERPSEKLYEAMVSCRTKALVCMYAKFRKHGSLA